MRPSAKHIMAAVSPKPSLRGHSVPCSWVSSRAPTATRGRSCHPRTWGDECVWFPRRCRTAAPRHMRRVEMDPGESPCCGTGSTGKPSGVAQVGEQAEAVPDGLAAVFLSCLCACAHTHTPPARSPGKASCCLTSWGHLHKLEIMTFLQAGAGRGGTACFLLAPRDSMFRGRPEVGFLSPLWLPQGHWPESQLLAIQTPPCLRQEPPCSCLPALC